MYRTLIQNISLLDSKYIVLGFRIFRSWIQNVSYVDSESIVAGCRRYRDWIQNISKLDSEYIVLGFNSEYIVYMDLLSVMIAESLNHLGESYRLRVMS